MFGTGLKIVNCIWGGFNGTNPRASTPQSAETAKFCAEICGTNLWPFLIVLWRRHFTNLQYTHFQKLLFALVSNVKSYFLFLQNVCEPWRTHLYLWAPTLLLCQPLLFLCQGNSRVFCIYYKSLPSSFQTLGQFRGGPRHKI